MFGSHKVKIEGELLEKAKQCSDAADTSRSTNSSSTCWKKKPIKSCRPRKATPLKEDIQKRLQGLGYIE